MIVRFFLHKISYFASKLCAAYLFHKLIIYCQKNRNMSVRFKGYLCLAYICLIWGSDWVVSKYVIQLGLPPLQLIFIKQFVAGVLLVTYYMVFKKQKLPTIKQLRYCFLVGMLIFFISNTFEIISLKFILSDLASLIAALYPIVVILLESLYFKKIKLHYTSILGIFLGILGVGLITVFEIKINFTFSFIVGTFISIFAVFNWGVGSILISKQKSDLNINYALGWQYLSSALVVFICLLFTPQKITWVPLPLKGYLALLFIVFFVAIFSYFAFIYSIKTLGVSITSLHAYIDPIITIFVAYIFLKEPITWFIITGSIITIIGVIIVNKTLLKNTK